MATLREIQLAELEMLKLLDKICKENNLKYSMIGGTMLGAIRHKGFIPWDDDIDVYMPLEDVRKLQKIFHEEGYFLQTPETDIQMPFLMYKIRKNGTRMVEPGTEKLEIHQGVWLDIFPYVNAGSNRISNKLQHLFKDLLQTYRCRYRYCIKEERRLIHFLLAKQRPKFQTILDALLLKIISGLGSVRSNDYFALDVGRITVYQKQYFDTLSEYKFEDSFFWGPSDYDGFLKYIYGNDYMIPQQWSHIQEYNDVRV